MPTAGATNATKLESIFYAIGIGLIAVDGDGSIRVEIRGRKLRPASRRLYFMAVGTALTEMVSRRKEITPPRRT